MTAQLLPYRHPTLGFGLPLPADWKRIEDVEPGVALIAMAPERPVWFRTNVVVTAERFRSGVTAGEWYDELLTLLPPALRDFTLIDVEQTRVGGWPACRFLAHHHAEPGAVTMEQWATARNDTGYTLTASAATLEYDGLAELFTAIAGSFRPEGEVSVDDRPL